MNDDIEAAARIAREACEWVVDLIDAEAANIPLENKTEFLTWLTQSPQHVREYHTACKIWRGLGRVDARYQIVAKAAPP